MLIRCFMLGPAERFLAELNSLAVAQSFTFSLKIYVDDVTLLLSAALASSASPWASSPPGLLVGSRAP